MLLFSELAISFSRRDLKGLDFSVVGYVLGRKKF